MTKFDFTQQVIGFNKEPVTLAAKKNHEDVPEELKNEDKKKATVRIPLTFYMVARKALLDVEPSKLTESFYDKFMNGDHVQARYNIACKLRDNIEAVELNEIEISIIKEMLPFHGDAVTSGQIINMLNEI